MSISTQGMIYVCELAEHLHFGKAAEACATSQPNLSVQIKNIEKSLGISIFERSNKQVLLTSAGTHVVAVFTAILTQLRTLKADYSHPGLTLIRIGIFPTLAPYLLPRLVPLVSKALPQVSLIIVEGKTDEIISKLGSGDLDCILVAHPIASHSFEYRVLFDDCFYLAVSTQHPFAKKSVISISDLGSQKFLLLEEGHCLRGQALDICFNQSVSVDSRYQSASLETLRALVEANYGITLMPKICMREGDHIAYIPLQEPACRQIALYFRNASMHRDLFKILGDIVTECVS
jgi:LysR family hydrogen peroxide-inducible transcriptional activator